MTEVGTIINEGDEIPADVSGLFDRDEDPWFLLPNGHWHGSAVRLASCLDGGCAGTLDPLAYAPLTVAAVRS